MIILHSQHDEKSRKFVELYGEGNTVISYPECVERFPWIRAFPSVIIEIPAHSVPAGWFYHEQEPYNVAAHEEIIDTPEEWETVQQTLAFVEEWARLCPPRSK